MNTGAVGLPEDIVRKSKFLSISAVFATKCADIHHIRLIFHGHNPDRGEHGDLRVLEMNGIIISKKETPTIT